MDETEARSITNGELGDGQYELAMLSQLARDEWGARLVIVSSRGGLALLGDTLERARSLVGYDPTYPLDPEAPLEGLVEDLARWVQDPQVPPPPGPEQAQDTGPTLKAAPEPSHTPSLRPQRTWTAPTVKAQRPQGSSLPPEPELSESEGFESELEPPPGPAPGSVPAQAEEPDLSDSEPDPLGPEPDPEPPPPPEPPPEPPPGPPPPPGPTVPLTRLDTDDTRGEDLLELGPDVDAFAAVMLSHGVVPLSVGLFGDWGSGKSFFMRQLQDRCEDLAQASAAAEAQGQKSPWVNRVAQIRFNAWHYAETSLWASLVTHLFDELARHLGGDRESIAEVRRKLQSQLQTAQELRAEFETELAQAREATEEARAALALQERKAEEARKRLRKAEARRLLELVGQDPRLRKELGVALKELGVDEGEATMERLGEVLRGVDTFSGRVQALMRAVLQPDKRRWVVAGIFILLFGVPVLLVGLWWVLRVKVGQEPLVSLLGAALIQTWVTISTFLGLVHTRIARLVQAVAVVEAARAKVAEALEREDTAPTPEVEAARQALAQAEAAEALAGDRLSEAQGRVSELDRLIAEARAGHRFYTFIQERKASEDYRKHLGLVALVRRDFEQLQELLRDFGESAEGQDRRRGVERIVLYIDDLDRCPPQRVVEVLQAVHLLLALPLFVVVVGVDSRWLQASLERGFEGMLVPGGRAAGEGEGATPLDYLEKIFQVPYCLPPIRRQGFARLVDALLNAEGGQATASPMLIEGVNAPNLPLVAALPPQRPAEPPREPPSPALPVARAALPRRPSRGGVDPELLVVSDAEQRVMEALYPCFRTPRAAKRFVNVYRLLRASATAAERAELAEGGDPCRAAQALLALAVGEPELGECALLALLTEGQEGPDLPGLCLARLPAGHQLHEVLEDLGRLGALPQDLTLFRRWAPRVARYSFRPVVPDAV